MYSLKNRIFIVTVCTFLLIIFSIVTTNIYIRDIFASWDSMNNEIRNIERNYIQLDFKLRILNNIVGQVQKTQSPMDHLIEPYERNYKEFKVINKELLENNSTIIKNIDKLMGNFLFNKVINLDELKEKVLETEGNLANIQDSLYLLEDIYGEDNLRLLELIQTEYEYFIKNIIKIGKLIQSINNNRSSMVLGSLNIILAFFFLIIVSLAFLVNRIISKDFNYMNKSLKLLNEGLYDIEKLPNINPKYAEESIIKSNVENIFREKKFVNEIKLILSGEYILDEIIDKLLVIVKDEMNTNRIGVAFIDYNKSLIIAEHGAFDYGRPLLGPGFSVKLENSRLKELVHSKKSVITRSIDKDLEKNPHSSSLKLLKKEGINSNMIIPLTTNDVVFGFLFFSSRNEDNYNNKDLELGTKIGQEVSGILNTSYLTKKMFIRMINSFSDLVEKKDTETGNHIIRMTEYCRIITEKLLNHDTDSYRVNESFLNDIINYSSAHDIGKVGIPDSILKKPGKLTKEEREVMETHTTIGAEVLIKVQEDLKIFNREFFNVAIEIAMYHHEKWDGSGYPKGLKGEDIPLSARIVALADVFDALTSKRVYKPGLSFENSLEIINQGRGSHFDPTLVDIFNDSLDEVKKIYNNKRLKD